MLQLSSSLPYRADYHSLWNGVKSSPAFFPSPAYAPKIIGLRIFWERGVALFHILCSSRSLAFTRRTILCCIFSFFLPMHSLWTKKNPPHLCILNLKWQIHILIRVADPQFRQCSQIHHQLWVFFKTAQVSTIHAYPSYSVNIFLNATEQDSLM